MRGVLVEEYTDFTNIKLQECPFPILYPHGVKIKIQAAGVSFATSLVVAGQYQRKPPLPFIPGTECAGYVLEIGDNVEGINIGDRVCAALDWGGQAEEVVAHEANVFHIRDTLDFNKAICFANCYLTCYEALRWAHLLNV